MANLFQNIAQGFPEGVESPWASQSDASIISQERQETLA